MTSKLKARILSTGVYLPSRILSNTDLEKMVDTTDEWIYTRTGIRERRLAEKDESAADMGAKASLDALQKAGLPPTSIDLILTATMTPDYFCPSTAALIQAKIGANQVPAMDLLAACSGYIYGLSVAQAYILSGMYKCILFVATEKMSAFVNYKDRSTCILFGDGASAAIITAEGSGLAIDSVCLGSDGSLGDLIIVPAGGSRLPATTETVEKGLHYMQMAGRDVFKHAVRRMSSVTADCLEQAGLLQDQISWLIPHQANGRIIDAIAKQMNISEEKIYRTLEKYGNTSASSIGIALNELCTEKSIKHHEHLLLVAFGGGLTWGASTLTKI